jgi:hypothetical protein
LLDISMLKGRRRRPARRRRWPKIRPDVVLQGWSKGLSLLLALNDLLEILYVELM